MSDLQPVFCGNLEYDTSVREVERLFDDYGPVDRIDMKTGFAFVFMKDSRDGDDAIDKLDRMEFGHRRRQLRVEWAKGNGETKKREEKRRKNCTPTDTLFVVNFDPDTTREQDLAKHFSTYGKLKRVQVKRNYGFVQYELLDDATAARNGLSLSRLQGRTITVEYVARAPEGKSLDEHNSSHSRRNGHGRNESPPCRRRSRTPDYGTSRQRSRSHGRQHRARHRSRTPPHRHTRSPGVVHQQSGKNSDRSSAESPAGRGSLRSDLSRSLSPKGTRSKSPTTIVFQDANSRAPSEARSPPGASG